METDWELLESLSQGATYRIAIRHTTALLDEKILVTRYLNVSVYVVYNSGARAKLLSCLSV